VAQDSGTEAASRVCTARANADAAVRGGPKSGICGPIHDGRDGVHGLDEAFCLDRCSGTRPGMGGGGSGGRV